MSIKNRIERAEGRVGESFGCSDFEHVAFQVFDGGDPEMQSAEAGRCAECGKPKRLIVVEIVGT
jgi:hypothetical protein